MSKIEWTEKTWNPIVGCSIVSPGCTNCYAMGFAGTRLRHHPSRAGLTRDSKAGPVWTGEVRFNEQWLMQPLRWKRPRMIFVAAHGDLFHENVPDEWIDRVFRVINMTPRHTYQILTKRARRMQQYMSDQERVIQVAFEGRAEWPPRNAWLGVSTEDQRWADERIPDLLATPAAVRFVSAEPLLGPIQFDLRPTTMHSRDCEYVTADGPAPCTCSAIRGGIDWIIVGGESGPNARPMHPEWPRAIRDQCAAASVPFFFKQWGEWTPLADDSGHWPTIGRTCNRLTPDGRNEPEGWPMQRVGKHCAVRLLDGRAHDGMPPRR